MRFAIFTHVEHKEREGKYYAYSPYIREMNLWLKQVEEVEVVAPLIENNGLSLGSPYHHNQINFTQIPPVNLLSLKNKFRALFNIPVILVQIFGAMRRADHLHLRCPGNIGLLAAICQVFFPHKPKTAKYAGNWDPEAKQPWTYKLQKSILSNTFLTRNMQVLVYGDWSGQTKNIKPFFTASFSETEMPHGKQKEFNKPFVFLFVGNLVEGKRPLEAIRMVEKLYASAGKEVARGTSSFLLKFYGDGPERKRLEAYCMKNDLEKLVCFMGNRPLKELKKAYQYSHFLVLPSRSEGWPKAVAEAMYFGCIPVASPVSCVPWMLGYGSRGVLLGCLDKVSTRNKRQLVDNCVSGDIKKLRNLMYAPRELKQMSEAAKEWSHQYTVERFEKAIRDVLNEAPLHKSFPR